MSSRKISILVVNRTAVTLTQLTRTVSKGSWPAPSGYPIADGATAGAISIPPGVSLTITASGDDGCVGTVTLADASGTVRFIVAYNHPGDDNPTTVTFPVDALKPDCFGWADSDTYGGHEVNAMVDLYQNRPVPSKIANGKTVTIGYVAPLAAKPYEQQNNCQDFINSMFQDNIRQVSFAPLYDQGKIAPYMPADYTGGLLATVNDAKTLGPLAAIIYDLWPGVVPSPATGSYDFTLIDFLAEFVVPSDGKGMPLVMYVPCFDHDDTVAGGAPKYILSGYAAYPFAGSAEHGQAPRFNDATVRLFLQLMLSGAHFVNIQADDDFKHQTPAQKNTGRDLYATFTKAFKNNGQPTTRHDCFGNSHYCKISGTNLTSVYYGGQTGEWADPGCALLLSLLIGKTADSEFGGQYNSFMQLEGWPANNDATDKGTIFHGGPRHNKDYDNYNASYWNISTFGACPYSEKRATAIFLAPASWVPRTDSKTFMMPYVGAETPQDWLQTDLVAIAGGA